MFAPLDLRRYGTGFPHNLVRHSMGFQIDIYSFHRDYPKVGLLYLTCATTLVDELPLTCA